MGLEAVERKVAAVDPSKVHALVEWLNEELAILGAMAPVVMKNADLHNMLEEIGIGDDAANDADLGEFASWINGDSDFATQLLDAVEAQKVQSDEDLAEQAKKEKKAYKRKKSSKYEKKEKKREKKEKKDKHD